VTSYPNCAQDTLSDSHRRMLFDGNRISVTVGEARGYRTIRNRSEMPSEFATWQRRRGLLVPTYSPDGKTRGHQLRPDRPIRRKSGTAPKYETPTGSRITLDVNPLMLEEVRQGDGDLWATEGCKKVDALASRGEPAVGFIGVWNMAEPKTKGAVPLACWQHVRLRGRRIIVVFDADARTNPDVQEALRRAVTMLEGLGATVLVVYLPAVNGDGKAGVDDYLAAGGTVAELRMMAGPYKPVDVGAERMSRDESLHALVEDLERQHASADWTASGGDADEDLYLALAARARKHGKPHPDGLWVEASWGALGFEAKIRSSRTVGKGLVRLEARGLLYRDNEDRKEGRPGAFVLRAGVKHMGRSNAEEGKATKSLQASDPGTLHPRAPRLWASRPKFKPTKKMIRKHRLGTLSHLPEPREGVKRLGKKRSHLFDRLDAAGGTLKVEKLGRLIGIRPRDLTRRKRTEKGRDGLLIWPEEAGILTINGDEVSLTPDWLARLEEQRERGEELEADIQATQDRRRRSLAYRDYLERKRGKSRAPKPSAASVAAIERSRESKAAGLAAIAERAAAAAKTEELRKAEAFVRGRLRDLGRIRLELLQDIAHDEGIDPWSIPRAVEALGCRIEKLPEYGNRRFVFLSLESAA
jgi:Domain of unknown function (DUF3854)